MSKQQTSAIPAYPHPSPQVYPQVYPQALPGQFSDGSYPPQQPPPSYSQHYQPQQQQQPQVVHTIVHQVPLGPESSVLNCQHCQKFVSTRVDYQATTRTHLMAGLLCLFFWPCFWIPYVCENCQTANHYCPHCNAFIGSYRG